MRVQIAEEGAPAGVLLRISPCSDALAFLGTLVLDTVPPYLLLVSKVAEHALPQLAEAIGNPQTAVQLLFAFSKQRAHLVPGASGPCTVCTQQQMHCLLSCCQWW